MVAGGPPERLNNRHLLMALMVAAGWRQKDIAAKLGFNPNRVSIICGSPLFKAQVQNLQRELRESTVADVVHRIATEAGPSLDVMVELRDHAQAEPVRLSAAKDILDRNPKLARVSKVEGESSLRVSFGAPELRQMFGALLEDDGKPRLVLDATALPPRNGKTETENGAPIRARPLEELIEAAEAAGDGDA